ncbi:MAG: hypothetical protein WCK18_10325 [Prolixibacteraceae bacterium]|jgi:hypothetical protein
MRSAKIQNSIIRKVLNTDDDQLLDYLNQILGSGENIEQYQLTAEEKSMISESVADYSSGKIISNQDVILRNEEWLKE